MRARLVAALYALLALLVVPVFPHFLSPNEFTRWAVAAALAERGTFEVSSLAPLLGPRFEDLSSFEGRLTSNKAPGAALVALPGYFAARPFVGPPSRASMRPSLTAMRLVGATLPAVLLALLLVGAAERFGGEASRAPLLILALLFGTPLFTYGLLLFSHALVALALFGAFVALFLPGSPRSEVWRELLAGALIGLAVVSEYPAAVPGLVLVAIAALRRRVGRVARVVLGGAPFALLLGLYDVRNFGGVFELSSAHENFPSFQTLATGGLFGIGLPSPGVLLSLLFDPGRGLLVFSPLLLLVPRAFGAASRTLPRDAAAALALVPLSLLVVTAGYPNWHGGWAVGPRYLVAALPFLVFPLAFRGGGRLEAFLLGASVLGVTLTSLVFPFVPNDFHLPWGTLALPLLGRGLVAPNLLHLVSRPLAVAVPFLLVAAAVRSALDRSRLLLVVLGAAAACGAGLLANAAGPPSLALRAEAGYLEDVYFERSGALERALPAGTRLPPRLLARREAERALPPESWPF